MRNLGPMDNEHLIRSAPVWYAVAISSYLYQKFGKLVSLDNIIQEYKPFSAANSLSLYKHKTVRFLFDAGLDWMIEKGMITIHKEDFGKPHISTTRDFRSILNNLRADKESPFYTHDKSIDGDSWLKGALREISDQVSALEITKEDLETPERAWAPLPLERANPAVENAISALDKAIDEIRKSNGYAAEYPIERSYILESLDSISIKLKNSTPVSVSLVEKFGLEPLARIIRRFGNTAIGVLANTAKTALEMMVKEFSGKIVDILLDKFK
jgi:hypothetical protein